MDCFTPSQLSKITRAGEDVPVYGSVCPILYQSGTDLPTNWQKLVELSECEPMQ